MIQSALQRARLAALALASAVALVPAATAQLRPETAFAPAPGTSFAAEAAQMAAYTCNPATVGPSGRCASTAVPGGIAASQAPQFLLVTFDDCITPGSERYVRSLFDGTVRNPDGRPVPLTYFVSVDNCPATGDGVWRTDSTLVKKRYAAGDEMAVHTRSHQTGATTDYATWVAEMRYVRDYFKRIGLGADAGRGFRSPYLVNNAAQFQALKDLGFLYDSTVLESPWWSPVSTQGTGRYTWPFTYDQYDPAAKPQFCEDWWDENGCPGAAIPGLWQIPLYYYVGGTEANSVWYGAMDIGHVDYSGYERTIAGTELLTILRNHRNARLGGNRAPMNLFFHANAFSNASRVATYKTFLKETLRRGDTWAVTMQGLIEWMKAPVPNSQMRTWYASYCQRHACAAPYAAGDELADTLPTIDAAGDAADSGLRLFPNPARETATATVTTATAGARLSVHDVLGREVLAEVLGAAGAQRVTLSLSGRGAGVYVVRVREADGRVQQQALRIQ